MFTTNIIIIIIFLSEIEINSLVYSFNLPLLFLFKDRHSYFPFLDLPNIILV